MQLQCAPIYIAVCISWTLSLSSAAENSTKSTTTTVHPVVKSDNHPNNTKNNEGVFRKLNVDSSMIQRALYVLIGITIIGVFYFLLRAVRLKKKTHQKKKYGLLSNQEDNMEMAPFESDEEDTTVYEAKALRR
ncbi:hypothetical protein GJAV_G00075530 [Gymnothorax javanicus]|nr:hypothetical protein GJAV_G00075530 [Gymnothorax javanicus]